MKCTCKVPSIDLEDEDLICQICGGKVTEIPVEMPNPDDEEDEEDDFF